LKVFNITPLRWPAAGTSPPVHGVWPWLAKVDFRGVLVEGTPPNLFQDRVLGIGGN